MSNVEGTLNAPLGGLWLLRNAGGPFPSFSNFFAANQLFGH
jgi:hypothetical protein